MNETENITTITAIANREAMNTFQHIMEQGARLRKIHQMKLPAIHVELDDYYDGGWAHTEHNTYYFDRSTDMVEFISMILREEQ